MAEMDTITMQRFRLFFEVMSTAGIARIEADYQGSDDEGWITECVLFNAMSIQVAEGSERSHHVDGPLSSMLESVIDFLNEALQYYAPGWENNGGGAGHVVVDVEGKTARFDHGIYGEPQLEPEPFELDLSSVNVATRMGRWRRVVVYEITAPTLEEADAVWGEDGPEVADHGRVELLDSGDITPVF